MTKYEPSITAAEMERWRKRAAKEAAAAVKPVALSAEAVAEGGHVPAEVSA